MFPQKRPSAAEVDSETYPLGEKCEPDSGNSLAFVALSHTAIEHRLYSAMLSAPDIHSNTNGFTAKSLMALTEIRSLSTIRRGLEGLVMKLSVAKHRLDNGANRRESASAYRVYQPSEVIARRNESVGDDHHVVSGNGHHVFEKALTRITENALVSRREAQVALCCVEGLTNAEIGKRLAVSEQTVKFHLRHVFLKFGVKRRAELISRLLS